MNKLFLVLTLLCGALPLMAGETGCIYDLKGPVEVLKAGQPNWQAAQKGRPVAEGERIRTGAGAWCEILFKDGSFIKMEDDSDAAVETLKASNQERVFSFSFLKGKVLWMVAKVKGKIASRVSVRTPSVVCAVRGTDFSIIVSTAGQTTIGLFEGKVAVTAGNAEKELLSGGEASADSGGLTVQSRLSKLMKTEERRYSKVKNRVENLRKRLEERDAFIDEYINRQQKKLSDFDARRAEKLKKR